ncbi:MAG TPA: DUF4191 domain-containing protein [Nitriliruptorales bacterium]
MKQRLARILEVWRVTRQVDDRLVVFVAGAAAIGLGVGYLLFGVLFGGWLSGVIFGLAFGLLGALVAFGRRTQKAQYAAIEGQPGAAYAVMEAMRGQWFITPAIAITRKQDMVHRAVGRCGVVLVAEGSPARGKQLLAQELKRHARLTGNAPLESVLVGDGDKQVPVDKLSSHLMKLPRTLKKTEVPRLEKKLRALNRDLPMPKGVIPQPGRKYR